MGDNRLVIHILSDSVGETGEQTAKAAVSQFGENHNDFEIKRHPYVTEKEHISSILNEAREENSLLVYTIVVDELKNFLDDEAKRYGIQTVDLMTPLVDSISQLTSLEPKKEAGIIRKLDEQYFKRVAAVEFAVKYDDGKDTRGIKKADIILLGISRTSKTPLSMFLAHRYLKVANVPLVPEMPPPDELFEIDPKKIIGLTTNPIKLNEVRQERLKSLGLSNSADYASIDRILKEIEYAENLMNRIGCPIIDVSNKAVEETASIISELLDLSYNDY